MLYNQMLSCVNIKEYHQKYQTAPILKSSGEADRAQSLLQVARRKSITYHVCQRLWRRWKSLGLFIGSRLPSKDGFRLEVVTSSTATSVCEN